MLGMRCWILLGVAVWLAGCDGDDGKDSSSPGSEDSGESPTLIGDWEGVCAFPGYDLDVELTVETIDGAAFSGLSALTMRETGADVIFFLGDLDGQQTGSQLRFDVAAEDVRGTKLNMTVEGPRSGDVVEGTCQTFDESGSITLTFQG
ncbi:MAG: hypothetical protein AAFV53_22845 [Myxococcota bacterium]